MVKRKCIGQIISKDRADQPRPAINITIMDRSVTAILDSQASDSFVNHHVATLLRPYRPNYTAGFVKGAVPGVTYKVEGHTLLKAKCSSEIIELPVKVVKDLSPDVILGHDFLSKYGVIMDYTAN